MNEILPNFNEALLELTVRCPLRCRHCYIDHKLKKEGHTKELDVNQWIDIMEKIKGEGVKNIVLLGGEPTQHPGFYRILQNAIDNFEEVIVETSGASFSKFSDYSCIVSISFESAIREINNEIRGFIKFKEYEEKEVRIRSVYEIALKKLMSIKNPKICRFTLYNSSDIKSMIVMAERYNANSVFIPLKPLGNAIDITDENFQIPTSKNMIKNYYDCFYANLYLEYNHTIEHPQYLLFQMMEIERLDREGELDNSPYKNELKKRYKRLLFDYRMCKERFSICGAGKSRLFINSTGSVQPCPYLSFPMGNIIKKEWNSIKENFIKFNNKISKISLDGKCAECSHSDICGYCIAEYIYGNKIRTGKGCPLR